MRQVLFWIPQGVLVGMVVAVGAGLLLLGLLRLYQRRPAWGTIISGIVVITVIFMVSLPPRLPIHGFGAMLFLAFVACTWLAGALSKREGIAFERMQDLSLWIFISGILGARVLYIVQYHRRLERVWDYVAIWDGGLVFYGSFVGGVIGFFMAHRIFLRKYGISRWKLVDIIGPCMALGLCLGRVGCLLNGCCAGQVACMDCPGICFPLPSQPRYDYVSKGLQTVAGFTFMDRTPRVDRVEPHSPAYAAGLRDGDLIVGVLIGSVGKTQPINTYSDLQDVFNGWGPRERGQNELVLTVQRGDRPLVTLPPFEPRTLSLHPTQVYESISMALLLLVLLCYYPLKKHDGSVFVVFMLGYAVHRFLNEMLRTEETVAFDMTMSENLSIVLAAAAAVLYFLSRRQDSARPRTAGAARPVAAETAIAAGPPPLDTATPPKTAIAQGPPRTPPSP